MNKADGDQWYVLLVDDDEDDYILIQSMLQEAQGRKVTLDWASSFETGQQKIQSNHYDAVLVDYDLGAHTGIELIREAEAAGYPAPLILHTGRGSYEVDVEAMQAGATLYLTKKEANPLLLERAIRYAIERKQIETELRASNERLANELAERQWVEGALREAHDRAVWLARFPDENPNPVARVSTDGRVLYRNSVAGELPGWNLEVDHLLPDPLRSLVEEAMAQGREVQQEAEMATRFYAISVMPFLKDRYANIYGRDITQRKQAEEALRFLEERFNRAFDVSPSAMAISRMEDGRILVINDSFEKLFGYPQDEVAGKTSLELNMYADPADRWEIVRRLREEKNVRDLEVAIRTRSGEIRQASFSVVLLSLGTETNMLTIIQDITERKQAEEALRQSEQHTRDILESISDAFYSLDPENRFTYVNRKAASLWGMQPEDLIGKNIWEVFPSGKETESYRKIQQAVANRQPLQYESYSAFLDEWVDVHLYPTEQGISVYFQDITTRKQAEVALRESEERFRQLADSMPQLVWTARPDGTADYYNQRHQEYHGIAPTPDESWQWAPALHPDDREATVAAWQHSVETGETYQVEHRVQMADGSYRWHLSRGMPVKDADGRLLRWYGTATDIHAQKLAEQALQDYAEKLKRSNQDLEQFAFVASHDLQEPLRKIKLFGNSLEHMLGENLSRETRDYLNRMHKAAERMQKMVNALLELSRVSTSGGDFEKVSLTRVAREAVSDLEARLHASRGRVEVGELPSAEVDVLQMRRLFQNLIGNALKFHKPEVPPLVRVSGEVVRSSKQAWVRLTVADNGIGFDPGEAERIFQPFQRLHGLTEYEGTGIGLAICQKIVERHRGKIEVRSAPGEGTMFWVTLPVRQEG